MEAPGTLGRSRADGELSDESSSQPESPYSDEYSADSASDEDQTFDNAQLLSRRRPQNRVPLALLCVADEVEIYELMCSALMQRRFLGIEEPLLGFTLSPSRPHLQLLVGWVEELPSHTCGPARTNPNYVRKQAGRKRVLPIRAFDSRGHRGVSFGAYPAIYTAVRHMNDVLGSVMETLILPRLCAVTPIPSYFSEADETSTRFDCDRKRLIYDVKESGVFRQFEANQTQLWYQYHRELALQQAFRACCGLESLLPLDLPNSGNELTRDLLMSGLRCTLHSSEKMSLLMDDSDEMEARQEWDNVIGEFFTSSSTAFIAENGYHMHDRLERNTPLGRNILLDTALRRSSGKLRIINYFENFADIYADTELFPDMAYAPPAQRAEIVEAICQGPDTSVLGELANKSGQVLRDYQNRLTEVLRRERQWRKEGSTLYTGFSNMDKLRARVLCDFDHAICNGLVFAEVEDVFDESDVDLKDELLAFGVVGDPQGKTHSKEEEEIDVVSRSGEEVDKSAPQIVQQIRRFARKKGSLPPVQSLAAPQRTLALPAQTEQIKFLELLLGAGDRSAYRFCTESISEVACTLSKV
ncbi:hypothetical protein HDZ31DRAFT_63481 [Schizophyllum fasciatum]